MSAPSRFFRSQSAVGARLLRKLAKVVRPASAAKPLTTLQEANPRNLPEVWFNSTFPLANVPPPPSFDSHNRAPNDRNVKLGKSTFATLPYRV